MATVRILLVDDFAPFRAYVRRILDPYPEWQVIVEAADGAAALTLAAGLQPDLILLDIGLLTTSGIEVAQRLSTAGQHSKILFVTSHGSPDIVQHALPVGAMGYVAKWNANRSLPRAIKAVMEGKRFVSKQLWSSELYDQI